MTDNFHVDPAHMRTCAARFDALEDRATSILARLRSALSAEGESWGADETGMAFARGYVPAAESGELGIERTTEVLTAFGTGLRATAESFEAADDYSGARLYSVGNGLGGIE